MQNFSIQEIKDQCSDLQKQILELYLQRKKQKDICKELQITRRTIDTLVAKYKLTRFRDRKNYCCTSIQLENPLFWYFLGVFASDGSLNKCGGIDVIQFTMDDLEVLTDIKNILGYTGNIQHYIKQNKLRHYLKISDSNLIKTVRNVFNSDCYKKTFNIVPPKIDTEEQQIMFLRGFIDGDGSYAKGKSLNFYIFKMYCASEEMYKYLLKSFTVITPKVHSYKNSYIEITSRKDVYTLLKYLYSIYPEIGMIRKKERAMQHIKNYELKI